MANGIGVGSPNASGPMWGAVVALSLHGCLALAIALLPLRAVQGPPAPPVEVDLVAPRPPEPLVPLPPPPPLPALPIAKPILRKLSVRQQPPSPPPMPNQEVSPPSRAEEPPKAVFGVTADSVVPGDSPVAVAVGNTLMTKDRTLAKVPPLPLPAAPAPSAFAWVDEESVAEWPEVLSKPETVYPEMAKRMGVEGRVLLRIGVDRNGNVKTVRILQKAGYGMDEEAVRKIWQYRWKPAKRADGEPVNLEFTYSFKYSLPGLR